MAQRDKRLEWDRDGADWPNREFSRFVEAAGLSWHIQRAGPAGAPKLLLVHGTAASTHSWGGLLPLAAERFDVLAFDLPGHGFTAMPTRSRALSLESMATSVAALLDAEDFGPQLVAGHSAGAAILVRMCLDGRIVPGAVISINGALLPFSSLGRYMFPAMARLLFQNSLMPWVFSRQAKDEANVRRLIEGTGSRLSEQELSYYVRLFRNPVHVEAALGMMANWDLPGLERELPRLSTPLVLVAGSEDTAVPPERASDVKKKVRGSEVRYLRGLGHLAHEEDPARIAAIIAEVARDHGVAFEREV